MNKNMRLIDADELYDAMENAAWFDNADRDEVAQELLSNAPIISDVRSGIWVDCAPSIWHKCSECTQNGFSHYDYCPWCGAKMIKAPRKTEASEAET